MSIIVDKATLTTLVEQQHVLFDHSLSVGFWVAISIIVLLAFIYTLAYRDHRSASSTDSLSAGQFCVGALIGIVLTAAIWLVWRVDTYFEMRQFERAPETYVIKHLR